jgi:hypothetical protein
MVWPQSPRHWRIAVLAPIDECRRPTGESHMKESHAVLAVAAVLYLGWTWLAPAVAAPPTVTPSPGYDARLAEQRAARSGSASLTQHRQAFHRRSSRAIGHSD